MYLLPFWGKIDCKCIYCLLLLLEKFNERVVLYILLSPATQFDFLWFLILTIDQNPDLPENSILQSGRHQRSSHGVPKYCRHFSRKYQLSAQQQFSGQNHCG